MLITRLFDEYEALFFLHWAKNRSCCCNTVLSHILCDVNVPIFSEQRYRSAENLFLHPNKGFRESISVFSILSISFIVSYRSKCSESKHEETVPLREEGTDVTRVLCDAGASRGLGWFDAMMVINVCILGDWFKASCLMTDQTCRHPVYWRMSSLKKVPTVQGWCFHQLYRLFDLMTAHTPITHSHLNHRAR